MSRAPDAGTIRREFAQLTVLCLVAVVLFAATRAMATANRQLRASDAKVWFARGQQRVAEGAVDRAVDALRRAVTLDPSEISYQLAVADALAGADRDRDARAVLTGLRSANLEDPAVNLRLARLEARAGTIDAAVRFYQTALAALWTEAESDQRRAVRIELVEFLLRCERRSRALAELLILNADPPTAVTGQLEMGRLLLLAGDPARATKHYEEVLAQDPAQSEALAGTGDAAFALGDYRGASRLLAATPDSRPDRLWRRTVAGFIVNRDPLTPRVGLATRRRRLLDLLRELDGAFASCVGTNPGTAASSDPGLQQVLVELTHLASLAPAATSSRLDSRDDIEDGLLLAARAIRAAEAGGCPKTPLNEAVTRMASLHGLSRS